MAEFLRKNRQLFLVTLGVLLFFGVCGDASAQNNSKKKKTVKAKAEELSTSSEPDKVLYDRAVADIKKSRYTEGRLSLQTLINTYPDSEYLAKSKLAIADSFFKEGGTSNLMQAIAEYKDFITFFPFLDEAAYAQMQVGTCHYRMMEKADRDTSQAQEAEQEFQTMLLKYPQSTFAPQAEQRLREVQEILADGEFRIARFYFAKQDFNAAGSRLVEVADRYPLYSQGDEVFWMLGDSYMHAKALAKNEDVKNYWAVLAAKSYDRLIEDYPMSKRVPDAKARLKSIGMPVPEPNPDAYARMQKEQAYQRDHHQNALIRTPMSIVKTAPDVSAAAHNGQPNLNPPSDSYSAVDVLKVSGAKPSFEATATSTGAGAATSSGSGGAEPATTPVEAVPQGSPSSVAPSGTTAGAEIIAAPSDANAAAAATSQPSATAGTPPANARPLESVAPDNPPATGTTNSAVPAPAQPAPTENKSPSPSGAALAATPPAAAQSGSSAASGGAKAPSQTSGSTDASGKTADKQDTSKSNPKEESTSKKKKGLHKLIPW